MSQWYESRASLWFCGFTLDSIAIYKMWKSELMTGKRYIDQGQSVAAADI